MYSVPVGACVFFVVPWFFNVFPPDFGLVCAYEVGDFRYTWVLWCVFAGPVSLSYFVANVLW